MSQSYLKHTDVVYSVDEVRCCEEPPGCMSAPRYAVQGKRRRRSSMFHYARVGRRKIYHPTVGGDGAHRTARGLDFAWSCRRDIGVQQSLGCNFYRHV